MDIYPNFGLSFIYVLYGLVQMEQINKLLAELSQDSLDPKIKLILTLLCNQVESLTQKLKEANEERQKFKDAFYKLKGEHGKPRIRPQSKDISSEKDRKDDSDSGGDSGSSGTPPDKKERKSKAKNDSIKIDREVILDFDLKELPSDAVFKGYQECTVQDIKITTDNVLFKKAVYYSKSTGKTYTAKVPPGYEGQFGPDIKTWVRVMAYEANVPLTPIVNMLQTAGIKMSKATLSLMLTNHATDVIDDASAIFAQTLVSTSCAIHLDDTKWRERGKNQHTHIFCNDLAVVYLTRPNKDRLTIIELLSQGKLSFTLNDFAYDLMAEMNVGEKTITWLKSQNQIEPMDKETFTAFLANLYPNPNTHKSVRKAIMDAAAIATYQAFPDALKFLIVDDAPQFKKIVKYLVLCWIHEGRPYKKLEPTVESHKHLLKEFRKTFWDFYRKLLAYKKAPTPEKALALSAEFDTIFSTITGYDELDKRIALSLAKKESLLYVLKFPNLPLHNNFAERGARKEARKRDISLQTWSLMGTRAKNAFMTVVATAKLHKVNLFEYWKDRITKASRLPSLASLIQTRNLELLAA